MKRLTVLAFLISGFLPIARTPAQPPADCPDWTPLAVPASWEKGRGGILDAYDGIAWYRCFVRVPAEWRGETLYLELGQIDDMGAAFFNGVKIGESDIPEPASRFAMPMRSYPIAPEHVRFGQANLVAVRVQDEGGYGGILTLPARLCSRLGRIHLEGTWLFRTGDDPTWAAWPKDAPAARGQAEAFFKLAGGQFGQTVASEPLAGTELLEETGDLASKLVSGADRFLLDKTAESIGRRARHWKRDVTSPAAYAASVEPNRARLARIVGLRDKRQAFDAPSLAATTRRDALVGRGAGYAIYAIRWPAIGGVCGEGLLLAPERAPVADIVAIPDAGTSPEAFVGLSPGVPPESQIPRRLAESGCRVVVPALIDRSLEKRGGVQLTNREFLYRSAYELGRHVIGYELQKVLAIVDWFERERGKSERAIGLAGWGEGGLLALYGGALDQRVGAVLCSGYFDSRQDLWQEPMDRNVFGLLDEFGDAEIASLIVPRRLVVEAARGPEFTVPPGLGGAPGRIVSPEIGRVRGEVARAEALAGPLAKSHPVTLVESGAGAGPYGGREALAALLTSLAPGARLAEPGPPPTPLGEPADAAARLARQIAELDRHNQELLAESPYVRAEFMNRLRFDSLEAFLKSAEWYRDTFRDEVIGCFADPLEKPRPRTRKVYDQPLWSGYETVLDVWPGVFAYGVLLVPKNIPEGERRPVVVAQHGLEGRPENAIRGKLGAYGSYGARLADEGFVVFAPQNLYVFGDRFRSLQRKANPLKKTLFSIIVPQHQQITDWLKTLPFVAGDRIAFYGISYGGKTAMRVPPLVRNYSAAICSADFNDWVWKNASSRSRYSYVGTIEYEIFEFDLGSTFNYSEMAALICPRPFMVERGHFDGVSSDEAVAYEFAKVRHLYQARLGIGDRCEIEWFVGPHEIHGVGTFEFLRRHLK